MGGPKKLLVISPHADDAELGCGGYIARTAQSWGAVSVIVLALGEVYFRHLHRVVPAGEREQELDASMKILGVSQWEVMFRGADGQLDTVPAGEIVARLDAAIETFQPTELLIPLPSSHPDHLAAYRACVAAARPSAVCKPELVAAYEYPASSWGEGSSADAGRGGMYVEIEPWLELKLQALRAHRSQIRENGHCFSIEAARSLATLRGLESGLKAAELFHVMRKIVP